MAIKRFGDYESTKAYGEGQMLQKGGYVLKIMGAEICENKVGQYVKIGVDIAEGEYKDYFANDYKNQQSEDKKWRGNYLLNVPNDDGSEKDGWTKRRFKTVIEALEESNPGYHFDWDEKKFKGKFIGGLFNEREYESNGNIKKSTNLAQLCSVEKIRKGTYQLPEDRLLNRAGVSNSSTPGFMNIPDGVGDNLPFD